MPRLRGIDAPQAFSQDDGSNVLRVPATKRNLDLAKEGKPKVHLYLSAAAFFIGWCATKPRQKDGDILSTGEGDLERAIVRKTNRNNPSIERFGRDAPLRQRCLALGDFDRPSIPTAAIDAKQEALSYFKRATLICPKGEIEGHRRLQASSSNRRRSPYANRGNLLRQVGRPPSQRPTEAIKLDPGRVHPGQSRSLLSQYQHERPLRRPDLRRSPNPNTSTPTSIAATVSMQEAAQGRAADSLAIKLAPSNLQA